LEIVLEDIPDYIDRNKIEKDIESLSMTRDTREWLKRTFNKIFEAEKKGKWFKNLALIFPIVTHLHRKNLLKNTSKHICHMFSVNNNNKRR
jgi:hypothetical protein